MYYLKIGILYGYEMLIICPLIYLVNMRPEYTSVKVPRALANKIMEIAVKDGVYRSVSEFILDSARRRLEDIGRQIPVLN